MCKEIIEQIKEASNEFLAANIVAFRVLGMNKKLSIACMEELARRKTELNSEFNFEEFITKEIAKCKKPNDSQMDLLSNVIKNIKQ
jgi:hypothetical protein